MSESQDKPTVGFIGLGAMGGRMAARLLGAGHPLVVYNRTVERTRPLAQKGARVATTPRQVSTDSTFVFTCLTDDDALREVMLDPEEGALSGADHCTTLIDTSTISPETSRAICAAARAISVPMIDAALSGSTPQAESGTLVVFVGGEREVYEHCLPLLAVIAQASFYMGPSGAGTTMKLAVNTLLGLGMQAVAEAIALGEKGGLERRRLLEVLGQTAVIAPAHRAKLGNVRDDHYPAAFPIELMHKDFGLILDLAARLRVPMPATAVASQLCAAELGRSEGEDYSAIVRSMIALARLKSEG